MLPQVRPGPALSGYRYIEALPQHSAGVAAEQGFEIERARFARPLPLADGFAAVESYLKGLGRPSTAFAACELRSPARFDEQEFLAFNRFYAGVCTGEANAVARTNVCPEYDRPTTPCLYAFSYTVPSKNARGTFVISGAVEAQDGKAIYSREIVRFGENSTDAMRDKLRFVTARIEKRLHALGFDWRDALAAQVYTVQNIGALVGEVPVHGFAWHFCRPPVANLEFEMDVRAAAREVIL